MNNVIVPIFDYDDIENQDNTTFNMSNRIFCTFSKENELDEVLERIEGKYEILYNKIFVLYSKSNDEYMCTYNVEIGNTSTFVENTVLVHRKKQSNTLYTINGLNSLIETLNNGVRSTAYEVNWNDYQNCILLTKGNELKRINTKLFRILDLN